MTRNFNYFEIAPQQWAEELSHLATTGEDAVIYCLWGAHENTRGMRDFTRSPKKRLEKVFSEAQCRSLKLVLKFGFPPIELAFPTWTYGTKSFGLNPEKLWDNTKRGYEFHKIPSFLSDEFQSGFIDFVEEALSIASLYLGDEGCIKRVELDLGVLKYDIGSDFSNNRHFKMQYDKKPWITAYDYRKTRAESLKKFSNKVHKLNQFSPSQVQYKSERLLAIDSTLIELSNNVILPFFPEALSNPMSTVAYRVSQYWKEFAEKDNRDFIGLSEIDTNPCSITKNILAIFGKYISSKALRFLFESAKQGTIVFFPFGYPVYGESGSEIDWTQIGVKEVVKTAKKPVYSIRVGNGKMFSSMGVIPMDEMMSNSVMEYEENLKGIQC